jgi:hypothetical protein
MLTEERKAAIYAECARTGDGHKFKITRGEWKYSDDYVPMTCQHCHKKVSVRSRAWIQRRGEWLLLTELSNDVFEADANREFKRAA